MGVVRMQGLRRIPLGCLRLIHASAICTAIDGGPMPDGLTTKGFDDEKPISARSGMVALHVCNLLFSARGPGQSVAASAP